MHSVCEGGNSKPIKLHKFEFRIMDVLWKQGGMASVRAVQESFPEKPSRLHHRPHHDDPAWKRKKRCVASTKAGGPIFLKR